MNKTEVIEEFWLEFIEYLKDNRQEFEKQLPRYTYKYEPTERNFWLWYMEPGPYISDLTPERKQELEQAARETRRRKELDNA